LAIASACLLLVSTAGAFGVSASSGTLTITTSTTLHADHHGTVFIAGDNVTLDCAGHRISSSDEAAPVGIVIDWSTGVTVKHCVVSGFADNGIYAAGGADLRLEGNVITGNGSHGAHLNAMSGGVVVENTARDNAGIGFVLTASPGTRIEGNTAQRNSRAGVALLEGTSDVTVANNTVIGSLRGLEVEAAANSTLRGNTATGNETGVLVMDASPGSLIADNVASNNSIFGFVVVRSTDETISGNTANGNGGNGFEIEDLDGCAVTGNTATGNHDSGFYISGTHSTTFASNVANHNADGLLLGSSDANLFTGNVVNANGHVGIWVTEGSSFNTVAGNTARGNSLVDVYDDGTGTENTYTDNSFGRIDGI
jgi:parallel beta-helix repeat protein